MSSNSKQKTSASEVLEAVHAVMRQIHAHNHRAQRDAELGITPLEARVLSFFVRQPGATLTELAEHSGRDKGQLARLVQALRDRDLLVAHTDENDRRATRLAPSPEAKAMHDAVMRQRQRLATAAAAGLSEAEKTTLLALLKRLQANLETAAQ